MDPNAATGTTTEPPEPAPTVLDGNAVGDRIHDDLVLSVDALRDAGVTPRGALVSMTESGAGHTDVSMKQQACSEVGVRCDVYGVDPDHPATSLFDRLPGLNDDPAAYAVSVQSPLPDHVDRLAAARRDPALRA